MTLEKCIATAKLSKHIGLKLDYEDVFEVEHLDDSKPMDGRGNYLRVYGVKFNKGDVHTFFFWTPCYGPDRFKKVVTKEQCIDVHQYGDATVVGTKIIGW